MAGESSGWENNCGGLASCFQWDYFHRHYLFYTRIANPQCRCTFSAIVHRSVAMLAFTGYITTLAGARLPGMESVGSGFKAFDLANVAPEVRGVFPLTLFTILCLEFGVMIDATGESEFPGDYRNGFDFGW